MTKDGLSFLRAITFRKRPRGFTFCVVSDDRFHWYIELLWRLDRFPRESIIRCKHEHILQLNEFKLARKSARCLSQYISFCRVQLKTVFEEGSSRKIVSFEYQFLVVPKSDFKLSFCKCEGNSHVAT